MAKIRHRTFELFDFLQEASDALATKSASVNTYAVDPKQWKFRQLDTALRPSGVMHVTFKPHADDEPNSNTDLGSDLADLAELLTNGSRVMLDFEGVSSFDLDAISKLSEFDSKIRNKGSRIVMCNLEAAVRASFFPNLSTN